MRIKSIALTTILIWGLTSCNNNPDSANAKETLVTQITPVDFVKTFEGQINNKYNIHMKVTSNNGNINGKYFYTKVGEELEIKGTINSQGKVMIYEYDSKGNQTGIFDGEMSNENKIEGFWSKPSGSNSMPFLLAYKQH